MGDELLFTVRGSIATPGQRLTLAEAGLRERRDLQEWAVAHPEILGPDIMIVTMEFDQWQSTAGKSSDRLDILGLHTSGELVVAELKRDKAPDTVEIQAVKYAAMVSRFTLEALAERHAKYLTERGSPTDADTAADALAAHAEVTVESLRRPRLVLLASDFPKSTAASAVWLREMGIDITLMQYHAYRTGLEIAITVSQLFPVPNVEDFTISPRQAEVQAVEETRRRRQDVSTVSKIIAAGVLEENTPLTLRPYGINPDLRAQLDPWLAENAGRARASWRNFEKAPLRWDVDGGEYSPTALAQYILREATGISRPLRGTDWWVNSEGLTLVQLAAAAEGDRSAMYLRFWTDFLDRLRIEHPDWVGQVNPPTQSWLALRANIPQSEWGVSFSYNTRLRCELYFHTGTDGVYSRLKSRRDDLEQAFGGEMAWEDLEGRRASRIAVYRSGSILEIENHREYQDWFIAMQERLRAAVAEVLVPS